MGVRLRRVEVRPLLVLAALVAGIVVALTVFGSVAETPRDDGRDDPPAAPFGAPLDAAIAYVGTDRVVYLVDLASGAHLGSKSIPNDRRPAAASSTHVYLGRLSAEPGVDNWDYWRALPWSGTEYLDLGPGNWLAFVPDIDAVVAAGHPLPAGDPGVRVLGSGGPTLAASEGLWGALTPVGDMVLARQFTGEETLWWLLGPEDSPRRIDMPDRFRPIAGGPGVVAGRVGDRGVVVDLATGAVSEMNGALSAAASWSPDGTLLATVTSVPGTVCVYRFDGTASWCRLLQDPTSDQRGGVSWSPDGSFLVVSEGGTLAAYQADGDRIGALDALHPRPQVAAAWLFVLRRPTGDRPAGG
jgi:hypothetical protein